MARQELSPVTRAALVEAAIVEFANHGFDGASTRAIAARAGVHQPQINYHFSSKLDLWRAAVDHLFTEISMEVLTTAVEGDDDLAAFRQVVRAYVRFAARRPELNRMMVKESSIEGPRLTWLVERHVKARFEVLSGLWERLRAAGDVIDIDGLTAFYLLVGAGTLVYTNAPEARLLSGADPFQHDRIAAHADALVTMLTTAPRGAERRKVRT